MWLWWPTEGVQGFVSNIFQGVRCSCDISLGDINTAGNEEISLGGKLMLYEKTGKSN